MALKIFFWLVTLTYGIIAVVCFASSAACIYTGKIAEGCLMGWFGLVPAAATAVAWWAKGELEVMSNESRP